MCGRLMPPPSKFQKIVFNLLVNPFGDDFNKKTRWHDIMRFDIRKCTIQPGQYQTINKFELFGMLKSAVDVNVFHSYK